MWLPGALVNPGSEFADLLVGQGGVLLPVGDRRHLHIRSFAGDKADEYRRAFAAGVKRRVGRYPSVVSDVEST